MVDVKTSDLPEPSDESLTVSGNDEMDVLKSGADFRETINAIVAASTTAVDVIANTASIVGLTTQVNAIVLLPSTVSADKNKLVSVDASGNYVLVANTSAGFQGIFDNLAALIAGPVPVGVGGDWAILISGGHGYWDTVSLAWLASTDTPPASNLTLGAVSSTTVGINISTGTNIILPASTASLAGLMTASNFNKLNIAATISGGKINNATIDSDKVNIKKGTLATGATIVWDIVSQGPIAEVSLNQAATMPLQLNRTGGTYLLRITPNGFPLSLTAFEAPEDGLVPQLSTGGSVVDELMFVDWGSNRVTVHLRKDIKLIS